MPEIGLSRSCAAAYRDEPSGKTKGRLTVSGESTTPLPGEPRHGAHAGRKRVNPWAGCALILCLAAGAVLFLWPAGSRLHRLNLDIWLTLRQWGLPDAVGPDQMEFLFNVLVFAVIVTLVAWSFPMVRLRWWLAAAVAVSLMIEIIQGFVLPDRNMDWVDVVANTTGAVLAASGVALLRWVRNRREWRRTNEGNTRP